MARVIEYMDELKTHLRGAKIALRRKTPDLARQEFYGLMMTHFAVRGLMHEAALKANEDPHRVSLCIGRWSTQLLRAHQGAKGNRIGAKSLETGNLVQMSQLLIHRRGAEDRERANQSPLRSLRLCGEYSGRSEVEPR